ncbi:hypothetical protein R3P38DRAFT_2796129 [Favolaschia claudopus]
MVFRSYYWVPEGVKSPKKKSKRERKGEFVELSLVIARAVQGIGWVSWNCTPQNRHDDETKNTKGGNENPSRWKILNLEALGRVQRSFRILEEDEGGSRVSSLEESKVPESAQENERSAWMVEGKVTAVKCDVTGRSGGVTRLVKKEKMLSVLGPKVAVRLDMSSGPR